MRSARSRLLARILADAAKAGLSARTVRIDGALRLLLGPDDAALVHAVAAEAGRAHARRPMVVHAALGVRCARARILAALVATRQTVRALCVGRALGPRASGERIARVASPAVARRMVRIVRLAFRIAAALDLLARAHALAIDAGLVGGTVAVRTAAHLVAAGQSVAGESLAAHAQRPMQLHVTLGVRAAAVALRARIAALLVDARPIVGAVLVALALRLHGDRFVALPHALHVRRAKVAARARALGAMIDAGAQGVRAARVHARIAALLAEARPIGAAVLVDDALGIRADGGAAGANATGAVLAARRRIARIDGIAGRLAGAERIADRVGGTRAHRIVVERVALGTVAADARARIDAPVIGAGTIARTVRRDRALRMAAGAGCGTLEAGHALAQGGLAAGRSAAHGVRAARRRVAWIRYVLCGLRFVLETVASAQRVAGGADRTGADRHVVGDVTLGLGAAGARTRIGALLVDAGAVQRTVGVAEALGPAADVRIAVVFGQALADGVGVLDATARVAAARRR